MIRKANIVMRNKQLPYDAFEMSAVIGAVTGVPKEMGLDQMLKERTKMDAEIEEHRKQKEKAHEDS